MATVHPNIAAIDAALVRARTSAVTGFLRYMREIHPADRLPPRAAFEPLAVPQLLGSIVLVEVHLQPDGAPPRFFVRLAGQSILDALPAPMMNRYIDEAVNDGTGQVVVDVRMNVYLSRETYFWHGPPRMKFRLDFGDVEYAHCPLSEDGQTVDRIVSCIWYNADSPTSGSGAQ